MIQIMLSQPQPLSLLLKKPPLPPHPPQQDSKRMIQIMEQHPPKPFPLLELDPHPHPVAVKSLILYCLQIFFDLWFIICGMACMCFYKNKIFILIYCLLEFTSLICVNILTKLNQFIMIYYILRILIVL